MSNLVKIQLDNLYFIGVEATKSNNHASGVEIEALRWMASQGNLGVVIGLLILFGWSINIKGLSQSAIAGFNSLNVLSDRIKNLIDFVDKKDREIDKRHDEMMHEIERIKECVKEIQQKLSGKN